MGIIFVPHAGSVKFRISENIPLKAQSTFAKPPVQIGREHSTPCVVPVQPLDDNQRFPIDNVGT